MFSVTLDSEHFEHRRLKYLRVIYLVCSLIILFFILRYNFEYHLSKYNGVLLPSFFLLICTPFIYKFSKSYQIAAGWLVFLSSGILTFFLYTSGGIQAPGIFWLTSIPITGGILYGRRGGIYSAIGMTIVFLVLLTLDHSTVLPNIVAERGIYKQEKLINISCFLFYSLLTTYYFIKNEDVTNSEIVTSKEELENFMRILIHDVANPAAFIQGGLEEIRNPELSPADKEIIMIRMEKNAGNLLAILKQVRQFKALQDGKIMLELNKTDVVATLKDIIDVHTPRILEKSLKVNINLNTDNTFVIADHVILHNIVLSNLISNAIKFSARGESIEIFLSSAGPHLQIRIQDHGIGIPAHMIPKIFSMTTSTTRSGTSGEKGTGYGLPLAREYVIRMNGEISATSREIEDDQGPRGTIITILLPSA
ncbi:Signal transduction histidine-protein kinase BarA [compost metagenome]